MGIISDHRVGIDIEYIDSNIEGIAQHFYSDSEKSYCQKAVLSELDIAKLRSKGKNDSNFRIF